MSITITVPAPNNYLTTVTEVKMMQGLDLDDETQDPVIQRIIASMSGSIERMLGRKLARVGVTEGVVGLGTTRLTLRHYPLVSVSEARRDGVIIPSTDWSIFNRETGTLISESIFDSGERIRQNIVREIVEGQGKNNWEFDYVGGYVLPGWPPLSFQLQTGDVDFANDQFIIANTLIENDQVTLSTTTTLPAPLTANTPYFVRNPTASAFSLSSSSGGTVINLLDAGGGAFNLERSVTLPAEIEEACIDAVQDRFASRGQTATIKSEKIGDWSATYETASDGGSHGLPQRVVERLQSMESVF